MFLAITFMCLTNGQCNFVFDKELTTEIVCQARNQAMEAMLNANSEVSAYRTVCVRIPSYQEA